MNTVVFFLAGVTIGLVTDKLYHSWFESKHNSKEADNEERVKTTEKKVSGVEAATENSQVNKTSIAGNEKAEPSELGQSSARADAKHDDLSQIKGVGVKLAAALNQIGVYTFEQLSSSPVDSLFEKLKATGGRFTRSSIATVVERAQLAVNER